MGRGISRGLMLTFALVAGACADAKPATQVMIVVDADGAVRARADAIRVSIQGNRGADLGDATEVNYGVGGELPLRFPLRVSVVPKGGDASRALSVRVAGLDSGDEFVVVNAVTGFVAHRAIVLRLVLGERCIDQPMCPGSETCNPDSGRCASSAVGANTLPELTDDAGADGGDPDAGDPDAGDPDAGDPDAGDPDAGRDAGVDAGDVDAGCVAGTRCDGDTLLTCSAGLETPTACAHGCGDGACLVLVPRNVSDPDLLAFSGGADLSFSSGERVVLNSATGEIKVNGAVLRAGLAGDSAGVYFVVTAQGADEPLLASFAFESLVLEAGATMTVTGDRAVALITRGTMQISGRIDVSAVGSVPGPSGAAGRSGLAGLPGSDAGGLGTGMRRAFVVWSSSGGGGAGGSAHGGAGGSDGIDDRICDSVAPLFSGGTQGAALRLPLGQPLVGGASGGGGATAVGDGSIIASSGGGGGGAIQLFSRTSIELASTGVIAAHGGGGQTVHAVGGGGGGAGGMILLEAPILMLSGGIYANGGGGAPGTYEDEASGAGDGKDGRDGTAPAPVVSGSPDGGDGGRGGAGDTPEGLPGGDGRTRSCSVGTPTLPSGTSTAGGGGGAAGRLYFATDDASFTPGGSLSPGTAGQVMLPLMYR